jgi:hypothetical protein
MSDEIIDLTVRQMANARENEQLRAHVAKLLECAGILTDALEQMWFFADRGEILKTLRRAIAVVESVDDRWQSSRSSTPMFA